MIEIRSANTGDLDWLVVQLQEFDEFYKTKKSLFGDESYVREKLVEVMQYGALIVACEEDKQIGFIAGIIQPHFYNPRIRVLTQLIWWVVPGRRTGKAAIMLMDEFIEYGKENADWITFTMSPMTRVNKSTFIKRGFRENEMTYILEVA